MQEKPATDQLIHFLFNHMSIQGAIVSLNDSYTEILQRHPYAPNVQQYLGEALAAVSLLSLKLTDQGSIILQTQSDGPLSLLLAQVNEKHEIRGLAKAEAIVPAEFSQAVGKGKLAITQLPQNYQGVVNIQAKNLAHVIENYFYQSDQRPSYVLLAADANRAVGFFLQAMPSQMIYSDPEIEGNNWEHILHLAKTLTLSELLSLDSQEVLYRLFHEEKIRFLQSRAIKFVCRCSREVMGKALLNLGLEDARKLLSEHSQCKISVSCEFCHAQTEFDSIDVENIFREDSMHGKFS